MSSGLSYLVHSTAVYSAHLWATGLFIRPCWAVWVCGMLSWSVGPVFGSDQVWDRTREI